MTNMLAIILSFAVIAALIIGGGGVWIVLKRPGERNKGLLMVGVAIVTLVNVWLLAAPIT
ncbi:hypothetical protein [Sphingosinicella sp.]|jgi:hypothetical protein|uniref:hypothetical protein n=1 Tax=Sphingosinicella sp. TaxID=1917971 RepID=UPI00182FFBF9|nr:hypothetical protein [Sphingosinicella sp.]MBA4757161.1 hypothetical protein [Sphingosinicella sp.]MEA3538031.1 hypothetical protein [Pseudomonadota bacterium]